MPEEYYLIHLPSGKKFLAVSSPGMAIGVVLAVGREVWTFITLSRSKTGARTYRITYGRFVGPVLGPVILN